jgi:chemotaxis protein methyltransferase CheR
MFPSDQDVVLSEEEFRLLRDFIHEKFGIYFDEGDRALLRSRLLGRLTSLDLVSFEDYYHYLKFGPERNEELTRMITHLTNNETYFYREASQLHAFSENVLRLIKDQKTKSGDRRLRIMSAGCSTGEEAHTLAMILHDTGQFFWNWDVQVIGLDVDQIALEKAKRGVYHHNSFRSTSPEIVERHFVKQGSGALQVKEGVRKFVRIAHGNILEPSSYEAFRPVDVIVCRNVLIYFSDSATLRAVRMFHDALVPGGYLLLGHAESLSRISDMFVPIRFKGAMIYQKPEPKPAGGAS